MRDVFSVVGEWLECGEPCALGTLVATHDSAPAPIGTTVAVDRSGRIVGNIGAGCHEGDIVEACASTIDDGAFRLLPINLSATDEISGTPGCGGGITIAVWRPDAAFAGTANAIALGKRDVDVELPQGYRFRVPAKRELIVVGATSLAQEISRIAHSLDFHVTVVDPRPVFATRERIPDAAELIVKWPDEYLPTALGDEVALLVISHDPKFDLPALRAALNSDAWYIGLLGSRRSQAARRDALAEMGFSTQDIARIHGPVGLDLGGYTASETALSILAQIVALQNDRSGTALETSAEPIHPRAFTSA